MILEEMLTSSSSVSDFSKNTTIKEVTQEMDTNEKIIIGFKVVVVSIVVFLMHKNGPMLLLSCYKKKINVKESIQPKSLSR
jgi:putative exporter of polyketide antibiotics